MTPSLPRISRASFNANPATQRLFGYTPAELIGQSIRILIPADRQTEEDRILAHIRDGQRVDHLETVRIAKGGRRMEISLTASPVRDASGAIVGVSKTARDITARKRAETALAAQQEWYPVTLASIGDGIIASDPLGHVTYMNGIAEALTGWTNENATGMPLGDVFRIESSVSLSGTCSWAHRTRGGTVARFHGRDHIRR